MRSFSGPDTGSMKLRFPEFTWRASSVTTSADPMPPSPMRVTRRSCSSSAMGFELSPGMASPEPCRSSSGHPENAALPTGFSEPARDTFVIMLRESLPASFSMRSR